MRSSLRRAGFQRKHRGPFLRYRHGGRTRDVKFWIVALTLCVLAALLALGIKILVEGVASTELKRYQPVDIPPEEIAPDKVREREVLKEQGRWIEPKAPSTEKGK
ncbi:MAG: hypothetical protein ACREI3_01960 [Nitrospirales bacterium]